MSNVLHHRAPSYAYNASAAALGGVINKRGRSTVVPTIGSVCLSTAGGEATNSVENYYRDDISFAHALTHVSGYSTEIRGSALARRYHTYADVRISKLQVFDRMKVNVMQATVTSERVIESGDPLLELAPDLSRFSIRLFYNGVVIDGDEVVPDVDIELCHAGSYADFLRLLAQRMDELPEDTQAMLAALSGGGSRREASEPDEILTVGQPRRPMTPAVNVPLLSLRGNGKQMEKVRGNRVNVPNFGRARFGEAIVKPDRQRVSLVRLSLDSDWSKTPPRRLFDEELLETETQRFALEATEAERSESAARIGEGDGRGGSFASGDSGSNGVPIWP